MLKRFLIVAMLVTAGAMVATAQPRAAAGKDVTVLGFTLHYLEAAARGR